MANQMADFRTFQPQITGERFAPRIPMDLSAADQSAHGQSRKIFRYAFILQFIAAIPFLWLAYATGKRKATLLLRSKTAPGTVVAVIPFRQYKTSASGVLYSRGPHTT